MPHPVQTCETRCACRPNERFKFGLAEFYSVGVLFYSTIYMVFFNSGLVDVSCTQKPAGLRDWENICFSLDQ